jgi:hypothetical protein
VQPLHPKPHSAYAIFINTVCEGLIPAWHDENGFPVTYATEREAQLEIACDLQERLCQFIDGERDFDDEITTEDFILHVDVWPDGSISVEDGSVFGEDS